MAGDAGTTYVAFGRAVGYFDSALVDVHGARAQRSNGKLSIIDQAQGVMSLGYGTFYYHGPREDTLRLDNMVRCTRNLQ